MARNLFFRAVTRACFVLLLPCTAAFAQTAPPAIELRTGAGWAAWPVTAPGGAAQRVGALDSAVTWRDSAPGLRLGSFEVRSAGRRNRIAIVELDGARFRFALGLAPSAERRTAADWLLTDSALVLAANTGLFRENGAPQGLVLIAGRRRSALAGWLDAVVVITDGGLAVTDVAGAVALPATASAFQTLPALVRDGRQVFGATTGLRLSRTHRDRRITLCLGEGGLVRLLLSNDDVFGPAASRIPVGLTIPEQAAIAAGAGCRDAVALDGGISAQIAVRAGGRLVRMPGWRRVPLMLLVRER